MFHDIKPRWTKIPLPSANCLKEKRLTCVQRRLLCPPVAILNHCEQQDSFAAAEGTASGDGCRRLVECGTTVVPGFRGNNGRVPSFMYFLGTKVENLTALL